MFISKYSNQKNPHCVSLYRLTGPEDNAAHRTKEFWATILDSAGIGMDEELEEGQSGSQNERYPRIYLLEICSWG